MKEIIKATLKDKIILLNETMKDPSEALEEVYQLLEIYEEIERNDLKEKYFDILENYEVRPYNLILDHTLGLISFKDFEDVEDLRNLLSAIKEYKKGDYLISLNVEVLGYFKVGEGTASLVLEELLEELEKVV